MKTFRVAYLLLTMACVAPASAVDITWDGGGTDNNWDTPENWSGDVVPTFFDNVIFDDTSIKDCVLTQNQVVLNFTMGGGYLGTLSGMGGDLTVGGAMLVEEGTITNLGGLVVEGDVTIVGGSVDLSDRFSRLNGRLTVQGGSISGLFGNVAGDVVVNGDGTINWGMSGTLFGAMRIQGGTVNWGDGHFFFVNDYVRTGGTVTTRSSTTFEFNRGAVQAFTIGAGGIDLASLRVGAGSSQILTIEGTVRTTGFGDGVFLRAFSTTNLDGTLILGSTDSFNVSGALTTLNILDGSVVDVPGAGSYTNGGVINQIGTGKVLHASTGVGFTDSLGTVVGAVAAGADIYITLFDDDENVDGSVLDTLEVTVQSLISGDSELITLTETGTATGEFRNTLGFPTGTVAGLADDGTLQQDGSEGLLVHYIDDEDADDVNSGSLLSAVVTWDGGGMDDNWDTAENWSTNVVPTIFDNVIFDGRTTKDCVLTQDQAVFDFAMGAGYMGILSRSAGNLTIAGTMVVQGGAITDLGHLLVEGDVTISGGSIDFSDQVVTIGGSFTVQGGRVSGLLGRFSGDVVIEGGTTDWNELRPSVVDGTLTVRGGVTAGFSGNIAGDVVVEGTGTITWGLGGAFRGLMLIEGGTVNWGDGNYLFASDYLRTGGTVTTTSNTTFEFRAGVPQSFTIGAGGIELGFMIVAGGPSQVLALNGIVRMSGLGQGAFFSFSSTTNLAGTLSLTTTDQLRVVGPLTTLNILDGSVVDAPAPGLYTNEGIINQIGTGKVIHPSTGFGFTDSTGLIPVNKIDLGEVIFPLLLDEDENINGSVLDTTQVTLTNLVSGDVEIVTLTERDIQSEDFFLAAGFPTGPPLAPRGAARGPTSGNGILEATLGNVIEIRYQDGEDPANEIALFAAVTIPDCNANGVDDLVDIAMGTSGDCDNNGVPDECQLPPIGDVIDCNNDQIPDLCQINNNDCNNNGTPDDCESFADCNSNGVADACDIFDGLSGDCNSNDIPDECELPDCDGDDIPDECEPDCDQDGTPDDCEVDCNVNGIPEDCEVFADCNVNSIPDECDIAAGESQDCNSNRIPDVCDIVAGAPDADGNGVPDECEVTCGDGFIEVSEACDDGGIVAGDGCSPTCTIELGFACAGEPSVCGPDCNANGVPDAEDISVGTSADCNVNGLPDACEGIRPSSTPLPDRIQAKNRYLSYSAGQPGRVQAVRVTLRELPGAHAVLNGTQWWVGPPTQRSELSGKDDATPPTFTAATLQCAPHFMDWSAVGVVHVSHESIVPNGVYDIQVVSDVCNLASDAGFSAPLTVTNSMWGDVVGAFDVDAGSWSAPDGSASVAFDVVSILDKFKNAPTAPLKSRVDIDPNPVDGKISIVDVTRALDAFSGAPFPFAPISLEPCP